MAWTFSQTAGSSVCSAQLVGDPRGDVNAVGDRPDGDLVLGQLGPEGLVHLPRDVPVQRRHAVVVIGRADREHRHREVGGGVGLPGASEREELGLREAERGAVRLEVALHELRREGVVAGGHGRVCREDVACRARLGGHGEARAVGPHGARDAFEREERRVPLVHVADRRREPDGGERVDAADAEHDLLPDAELLVAAVKGPGDVPVGHLVPFEVRIEQEQGDAPDLHLPELRDDLALGVGDLDGEALAVGAHDRQDGQAVPVVDRVTLRLQAVVVQKLAEVPLRVREPDAHERKPEVAGRLEVVAREDTEAAGVDGQRFVQAVLHREVGDGGVGGLGKAPREPALLLEVLVERGAGSVEVGHETVVGGELVEALLPDAGEELDGVAVDLLPLLGVDADEQLARHGRPGPPEVVCEVAQPLELGREAWDDCEAPEGRECGHGDRVGYSGAC
jgi:hypothetical protein